MLRPASPLSALVLAAFVLLLLAILSPPILTIFPLAQVNEVAYGVFGTCSSSDGCSAIKIGYGVAVTGTGPNDFLVPDSARSPLATVLILHPVAALFTIVLFVLALVSHIHSAAHSSGFLVFLYVFSLVDFVVCLATFLVDFLLFSPHLAFASYFVLAAAIIILIATIFSFTMQRVIAGRKRRERLVAANAEMSGENYYTRETFKMIQASQSQPVQPTYPIVTAVEPGASNIVVLGPSSGPPIVVRSQDRISDERIPLTMMSPSELSPEQHYAETFAIGTIAGFNPSSSDDRSYNANLPVARDQYGNPQTANTNPGNSGNHNSIVWDRSGLRGSQGYGQLGRPQNRNMPYNSGPQHADVLGNPFRQGQPLVRAGYGAPRGYDSSMRVQPGKANGFYSDRPTEAPYNAPQDDRRVAPTRGAYDVRAPAYQDNNLPRAESPPPLDYRALSNTPGPPTSEVSALDAAPARFGFHSLRDSDSDIAGLVDLQQSRAAKYGAEETTYPTTHSVSPLDEAPSRLRYYEDVSPRFAVESPPTRPYKRPAFPLAAAMEPRTLSPANSDRSGFTSISQRGVNPRWNAPVAPPVPSSFRYWGQQGPSRR